MNMVTIGKATLMQVDCMKYLATLPDKHFALAIVDPPYGLGGRVVNGGSSSAFIKSQRQETLFAPTQAKQDQLTLENQNVRIPV